MSGPDQLLLFLGEITCKGRDALPFQPNASVCNLDTGKDLGRRKLLLQTLCGLVGIRGKRRDVDKRGNSRVSSGRRDDRTIRRRDAPCSQPGARGGWRLK